MRSRDAALGLQSLATLLEAGLPVDQALGAFDTLAPPGWVDATPAIRAAVRRGEPLSSALREHAPALPEAALGVIRASEVGGGVSEGVQRAADLVEAEAKLRSSIRAALAYPLLLAFAGVAAIALLVGVVLPRFAVILEDLGTTLPATTRIVVTASEVARTAAIPGTVVLIGAFCSWSVWVRRATGRRSWHRLLLRVPGLRRLRLSSATARTCAAMSALLRAGSPLPSALRSSGLAGGDAEIERRFEMTRSRVARGERLGRALHATHAITPAAIRLVSAGERSGRLPEMVERAGELEAETCERSLKQLVRMIEPLMILVFGLVVAFVAAALLQAVYSVRPV